MAQLGDVRFKPWTGEYVGALGAVWRLDGIEIVGVEGPNPPTVWERWRCVAAAPAGPDPGNDDDHGGDENGGLPPQEVPLPNTAGHGGEELPPERPPPMVPGPWPPPVPVVAHGSAGGVTPGAGGGRQRARRKRRRAPLPFLDLDEAIMSEPEPADVRFSPQLPSCLAGCTAANLKLANM